MTLQSEFLDHVLYGEVGSSATLLIQLAFEVAGDPRGPPMTLRQLLDLAEDARDDAAGVATRLLAVEFMKLAMFGEHARWTEDEIAHLEARLAFERELSTRPSHGTAAHSPLRLIRPSST